MRYGIGLLLSVLAVTTTYALEAWVPQTPAPILFAAVALAAWYGGIGPGLLSTAICTLGLNIFLERPAGAPSPGGSAFVHLIVFVLVAVLVSTLTERMRNAEAQARADADRLSILADASRAFSTSMSDQQSTLQAVARHMGNALGDACVVSLLSEDEQQLSHAAWYHRDPSALEHMDELYAGDRQPSGEGIAGRALREDRPVIITTDDPDQVRAIIRPAYAPLIEDFPIYSIASIPLKVGGRSIGVLALWRGTPGRPFIAADLELLKELANRSAMAIERIRLSAYYHALFSGAPEPIVVLDSDQRLLDANPAAAELLGTTVLLSRGQPIDALVDGGDDDLVSVYDQLRTTGHWRGEMDLQRASGETVPVEATAVAVHLLTDQVYIWVWHDLTEQRSLQKVRDDFIASASHELRTPLTAALAALGLMQQPESGGLLPHQRELVDNAMRNVLRLRILVNDLLAEGELRANMLQLHHQSFDLRQVITGAVESVHPLLQRREHRVELDIPEPLMLTGDMRRLEQVFVNLLANANLHTPKGSRIEIKGRAGHGTVRVSVCDDGPGIPEEHVGHVFERFSRADTTATGTGLGLAITQSVVTMHEGEILAENLPGRGAAFHITLPSSRDRG